MRRVTKLAPLALALPLSLPFAGTAFAATGTASANLTPVPLNGSSGSGTAMVTLNGSTLDATVSAQGLVPGVPHAQHIHFGAQAAGECPTAAADTDGDGNINTSEGAPAYGPVQVSLTTSGDTSAKSTLAVDRFPTGDTVNYSRSGIPVASDVAQGIADGKAVVVIHGVDYNGNNKYDGSEKSDLDPSLPTEASDPALCGVLTSAPSGGVATGLGGGSESNNAALIGIGGGLVLAAVGTGAFAVRRRSES